MMGKVRYRRVSLIAVVFIATTTALIASTRWHKTPVGPRLELPQFPLRIDCPREQAKALGSFQLGNRGDRPLSYRLQPSCGCSELTPIEGVIKPLSNQIVRIGIDLTPSLTAKEVLIAIETNDSVESHREFRVSAVRPRIVAAKPDRIDFGLLPPGAVATKTCEIVADLVSAKRPINLLECDIKLESDCFRYEIDRRESTPDRLSLTFRNKGVSDEQSYRSTLKVIDRSGKSLVEVPIDLTVRRSIVASPAVLFIDPSAGAERKTHLIIVKRTDGKPLGEMMSLKIPEGFEVESQTRINDSTFNLKLRRTGALEIRKTGSILLSFSSDPEPIGVRLMSRKAFGSSSQTDEKR